MAALALPGVEADVMVVAAGGNERGVGTHPLHQLESQYAAIERQGAVEIRHFQMNMPDPRSRDDGWIVGHRHGLFFDVPDHRLSCPGCGAARKRCAAVPGPMNFARSFPVLRRTAIEALRRV